MTIPCSKAQVGRRELVTFPNGRTRWRPKAIARSLRTDYLNHARRRRLSDFVYGCCVGGIVVYLLIEFIAPFVDGHVAYMIGGR